jgi:hypothetical protein
MLNLHCQLVIRVLSFHKETTVQRLEGIIPYHTVVLPDMDWSPGFLKLAQDTSYPLTQASYFSLLASASSSVK